MVDTCLKPFYLFLLTTSKHELILVVATQLWIHCVLLLLTVTRIPDQGSPSLYQPVLNKVKMSKFNSQIKRKG